MGGDNKRKLNFHFYDIDMKGGNFVEIGAVICEWVRDNVWRVCECERPAKQAKRPDSSITTPFTPQVNLPNPRSSTVIFDHQAVHPEIFEQKLKL